MRGSVKVNSTPVKLYMITFDVIGKGHFPYDMLRYDQCHPYNAEDAEKLAITEVSERGYFRTIKLVKYTTDKRAEPTYGRWASFGWSVVNE